MIDYRKLKGGGMDTDSAPQEIAPSDWVEAWNLSITGIDQGESGDGTNLSSTVEVVGYELPDGINKCIGARSFDQERVAYFFIYNSFGFHQLSEYNYDSNEKRLLFTDLVDTDGVQVLALNPRKYVMDIKLADSVTLIFTDSNIEVGCINIERLKNGGYGTISADDFKLIKAQPLKIPTAVYNNDAGRVVNLLKEKLFQFRNKFNYLDDEPSTYSSISKRITPTQEATTSVGEDVTKNNNLIVTVDIGTDRVKSVEVAARYSMYDWFTIKTVLRSYVLSLPNLPIDIASERYERYDPTNNTYSFVFYNDGLYPNIDPTLTDEDYDAVPRKAESLELLESNILSLAGLTEGYERPVVDVNITVSNYDPHLIEAPIALDYLKLLFTQVVQAPDFLFLGKFKNTVEFIGVAKTGDIINIQMVYAFDTSIKKTYTYEVEPIYNNDTFGALKKMALNMSGTGVATTAYTNNGVSFGLVWIDFRGYGVVGVDIKYSSVGSGQLASIQSLKLNSSYQLVLRHHDKFGRDLPGNTGDNFVFKTSSYAQSRGLIPMISWQILSPPPVEAASAQWLLSENTTHQKTLYVNAKYLRVEDQYMILSINPLKIFNERNSSSVLNYEYSEGDRATFNYYNKGGANIYFDNPFIDVQVSGFDIVVDTSTDPDTTTWELKVRLNSSINIADITGSNIYIEIYTPKKRVITDGDTTTYLTNLFYEVGEQILIENGSYSRTSGTITDGDVYFQTRDYVSALDGVVYNTYLAEDFNFNPLYHSNYTSYGRGYLYVESDGIKYRKAGMRYSDKKLINTNLNMLNKFFGARLYGDGDGETSSTFGWIRKIRQRDNYLVVLQESKVGHVPLNSTIVEDQSGQTQAFLSDKLFNKVRYSQTGNRGMGNARECYSESPNGTIYFIDPNNSVPMREGYDGLRDISGKMSKFFKKTLQRAKQMGRDIIAIWDNYTEVNTFSIQSLSDEVVNIPINDSSLIYLEPYNVTKEGITIVEQMTKGVVSFIGGEWIVTPTIGETGSDSFKISFIVNGNVVEKTVCVTIEAGTESPIPFLFNDVINAELNTLYASNPIFITGSTNPLPFNVVGGEYTLDEGDTWLTGGGIILPDSTIQVRRLSSSINSTMVSVTLTVGTYSDSFDITTKSDPDPEPFAFTPVIDADLSTLYTSDSIDVLGIDVPISISVVDGEYEINNSGVWTSLDGMVELNDSVKVRLTSSPSYNTTRSAILDLNGVLGNFDVKTKQNLVPDPFAFTPVVGAALSTVYVSNTEPITGITAPASFTVSAGTEYQIDEAGSWLISPGTITNNQTIRLRVTSSDTADTAVVGSVTITGVTENFTVTTAP